MSELARYSSENKLYRAGDVDGLEELILQAIETNDKQKLTELVPAHYRLLRGAEKMILVLQAIDDWRIAYLGVWEAYATSALEYFRLMAIGDAEHIPATRLANANAIQFFHIEQGWSVEELALAGITKLTRHCGFCRENAEEFGGEIDPRLKELMLDEDHVSVRTLRNRYSFARDNDQEEYDPDKKDSLPAKYRQYIATRIENGKVVLEVWDPHPDEESQLAVAVEIGQLNLATPRHQELVARFLEGELEIRGWMT